MILDKVNLYLEGLEQAPSVHDSSGPEVKSPSTQDEANALHVSVHALNLEEVNNEDDSVVVLSPVLYPHLQLMQYLFPPGQLPGILTQELSTS